MKIVIHVETDANGVLLATHSVETAVSPTNQVPNPANRVQNIDVIQYLLQLKSNAALQTADGWSLPATHPNHVGLTRYQVLLAEIVRLNDTAARTVLGV